MVPFVKKIKLKILFALFCIFFSQAFSQQKDSIQSNKNYKWFSLGGRSTMSAFGNEGNGIGTGGQFRLQLSNSVNTDWFADYISINVNDKVRSEYWHIGWSVLFYPFPNLRSTSLIQPYILAGHCFDYNKMTAMNDHSNYKDRLGSAVQGGLGMHFNLTPRFDITLMSQYMIHLTEQLYAETDIAPVEIHKENGAALQGHLLTTISLNYKVFRLWKGKN
ncbi:MAG: hypothetical protein ACXVNM_12315 [Bacteroidia bacterium]